MTRCKGCGKRIVWGKTDEGKNIPLDPSAPVYEVENVDEDRPGAEAGRVTRTKTAMVSHFKTCPNANEFSAGNKQQDLP